VNFLGFKRKKMKLIIVGNGIAGVMTAKILRDLGSEADITLYSEEKYHYYPRPNLIEHLAGNLPWSRLFPFDESWYRNQNIDVNLGEKIILVHPNDREVELKNGRKKKYDKLLLANGARASLPPIKGTGIGGIFTLRTLDDGLEISEELKSFGKVTVLGGGLLGLEIARAIKTRGIEVEVIEYFDRLLWRQLDGEGSALLQSQIEKMGIRVRCGMACTEAVGTDRVSGLKFKSGETLSTEMVVIAAGISPDVGLARQAGLETDKGVLVNPLLQSSAPDIYAAGDIIQHDGRIYGIIPASYDQARVAAHNLLGEEKTYSGTIPSNSLKVVGLSVTSIGLVNPDDEVHEEFRRMDKERGLYRKIVLDRNRVVGAIWMGEKKGASEMAKLIAEKADISPWKESVLNDNFDFSQIEL
jgi:nitrite reductase (NADH) large subunit